MINECKYLSPLVSCLECRVTKSAKGIFSHFITAHTDAGRERMKTSLAKGSKVASQNTKRKAELARRKQKENYNLSPNICECGEKIVFEKRNNKYCTQSCAATHSGKKHTIESRNKQKESIAQTISSRPTYSKIKFKVCKHCSMQYAYSKNNDKCTPSFCSISCFDENKRITSREMAIKRNLGGVRQSKRIQHKGVSLGSSYELKLALILDKLNIKWNQPKRVKYTQPCGKNSTYTADFYLPEYDYT